MSRVVEFHEIGGPENLRIVEREIPAPGANEVQVDIRAAGLNRAELMYLAGQYLAQAALPSKIGVEASGVVTDVGAGVSGVAVGDAVSIVPNMQMYEHGVLATRANVPRAAVVTKPDFMSFEDAAAFWMAYPTAYGGLVQAGGLEAGGGQVVVVTAASSSVGVAAIQIAKAHGATVIATTRSREKADAIRDLGPDHVIATDDDGFPERVLELSDGKGFDIAFDPVMGPFVELLASSAARGATLVEYGILSGEPGQIPFFAMIGKALTLKTFHVVFDLLQQPQNFSAARDHLLSGAESGTYKPVIDERYSLDEVADAYRRLASNGQFGKVIVNAGT